MSDQPPVKPRQHHIWHITKRTLSKSWDDSIFSESAQAAFWCALSLPPLLLGMLGSLAYIAPLFGPGDAAGDPGAVDQHGEPASSRRTWSARSSSRPSATSSGARAARWCRSGFVISLWAGSSAVSAFVDSITEAHDQTPLRHPVRQRFFALGLYVVMLVLAIATAPFVALGPLKIGEHIPESWDNVLQLRLLPRARARPDGVRDVPLPGVAAQTAAVASAGPRCGAGHRGLPGHHRRLRIYLTYITSTGYTYGALATPIAFLLFAFFLGFAIMIGAELNAAIQEEWPAPDTHAKRFRWWLEEKAAESLESFNGSSAPAAGRRPRPRRPRATPLLLELLEDPLAVRAHRRTGLGGLRDRKHLAAQRDHVRTHDRAFGDLVLLDVMEELRGVAVSPVVDAFVGVGALDASGFAWVHCARQYIGKKPIGSTTRRCGTVGHMKHGQELGFDDDGRPVLITAAAPAYEEQHRERVRKYLTIMAFRIPALILAAVAYGVWENGLVSLGIIVAVDSAAVDRGSHRQRPAAARAEEPRRYEARRIPLFPTAERPAIEQRAAVGAATRRRRSDGDVPS